LNDTVLKIQKCGGGGGGGGGGGADSCMTFISSLDDIGKLI
jgi:hypothetical protein